MVERSTGEAGLASPLEGISDAVDMGTGRRSGIVAIFKTVWWVVQVRVLCVRTVWINDQ
jgi:hypothetical protein